MKTEERAEELFQRHRRENYEGTDQVFVRLLLAQWAFAVILALVYSPYAWAGRTRTVHAHVWAALVLGGILCSGPIALATLRPGAAITRHVMAVAQMLWSSLLIHLGGGRIEMHFHIFGSLAFLSFYRDYRVILTGTLVVTADHFLRGLFYPESIYGIVNPAWWRFLEHAFWVAFEDIVLFTSCRRGIREMRAVARERAEVEAISSLEKSKSEALDRALAELHGSQDALVRQEKLAAIGQLAASVGHELRNPLAAIANANRYLTRKLGRGENEDARIKQFFGIIDQEVIASERIIADLLDFARERPLTRAPCPLAPLVDEAISLVPRAAHVALENGVPQDLPVPTLDKDRFRQILINLVQNAIEAIPAGRPGTVVVSADGGGARPWTLRVRDDGAGIPADVAAKVFQPLFTTKSRGTGLGLAIVAGMVERHRGTIRVDTEVGRGTTFIIELPAEPSAAPN